LLSTIPSRTAIPAHGGQKGNETMHTFSRSKADSRILFEILVLIYDVCDTCAPNTFHLIQSSRGGGKLTSAISYQYFP